MMDAMSDLPPPFQTARFALLPQPPVAARELLEYLVPDETMATDIPGMTDAAPGDARLIVRELEAAAERGVCKMWTIVTREASMVIGLVLARNATDGIAVEVMVSPEYEAHDAVDEVCEPVLEWLDGYAERMWSTPTALH